MFVVFFWFQIAFQTNKYQLDKCCPICPHVAKTNMLTDSKIHAKGATKQVRITEPSYRSHPP